VRHRCFRIVLVTIAFLVLFFASLETSAQEVTLTSKLSPIYLGQQGGVFYDGPVQQTDVYLEWGNGVFVDVWTSTGFNTRKDFDKELDFLVGYAKTVGRTSYSTDFQYYVVQGGDVVNWNGEVDFQFLFVRLEVYAPSKRDGPHKGLIPSAGIRLLQKPLFEKIERIKLDIEQLAKHDTGCFGFDAAWLYQGNIGVSLAITSRTSVNGGFRWSIPLNLPADGRKGEAVWKFGFSRSFGN